MRRCYPAGAFTERPNHLVNVRLRTKPRLRFVLRPIERLTDRLIDRPFEQLRDELIHIPKNKPGNEPFDVLDDRPSDKPGDVPTRKLSDLPDGKPADRLLDVAIDIPSPIPPSSVEIARDMSAFALSADIRMRTKMKGVRRWLLERCGEV